MFGMTLTKSHAWSVRPLVGSGRKTQLSLGKFPYGLWCHGMSPLRGGI